jgi:hypothetical protein
MENITGTLIRKAIKQQGRTNKWVGEQIGISQWVISHRLCGRSNFTYEEIRKLRKILNLPGQWFGLSEEQEHTILELYYNGMEDVSVISSQVNSTIQQVSEFLIFELKSK